MLVSVVYLCVCVQDFNMQSVQRRLGKMRGEGRSNEEGVEQEAKIKQLTAELDQKTAVHTHLNEQIKRVNVRTHAPHQKHSSLYHIGGAVVQRVELWTCNQ